MLVYVGEICITIFERRTRHHTCVDQQCVSQVRYLRGGRDADCKNAEGVVDQCSPMCICAEFKSRSGHERSHILADLGGTKGPRH